MLLNKIQKRKLTPIHKKIHLTKIVPHAFSRKYFEINKSYKQFFLNQEKNVDK